MGKPKSPHAQIFLPYTCFVCHVMVNSQQTEELHINGKKHKKALIVAAKRANGELPAAKKVPGEQKKSRKPKKNDFANQPKIVAAKRANGELPAAKKVQGAQKKSRKPKKNDFAKYSCEYCKIEITSKKMEETHIAGKKHLRKKRASVQQDVQSSFQDIQPNKVSNDIWQVIPQPHCFQSYPSPHF